VKAYDLAYGGAIVLTVAATVYAIRALPPPPGRAALPPPAELRPEPPRPVPAPPPTLAEPAPPAPPAPAPPAPSASEPVLRVLGTVRSEAGRPLAGVRVRPEGGAAPETLSDPAGAYEVAVPIRGFGGVAALRFLAEGYEERRVVLAVPVSLEERLDVVLEPRRERAVVSGTLRTLAGEPISGETVQLESAEVHALHTGRSDERGLFVIRDVKAGAEYSLLVRPRGGYREFWQRGLRVPPEGLELDVVLEPSGRGRLRGRVVDVEGQPLPELVLWVRSAALDAAPSRLETDASGYFTLEDAPAGPLAVTTGGSPNVVRGPTLAPGTTLELELVVDHGEHELPGRVVDERGDPLAGAELDLSWSHESGDAHSTAMRRLRSDADGSFRFEGLGPGPHRLVVRAAGHREASGTFDVGAPALVAEIRLAPLER
jgi:hypothetical protein